MHSQTDIERVLRLVHLRRQSGSPLLIAVEGLGGAGKSTLAAQLSAVLTGSSIVEVDDFYRPMTAEERAGMGPREGYERYFDWTRLLKEAIEPLRQRRRARFRRYDWEMGRLRGWREVAPGDVVIVEDIVDSGTTLNRLCGGLADRHPASLEICALLHKRIAPDLEWEPRWVGFDAPNEFLVGYGLDHAEDFRHLPFIACPRA